MSTRGETHRALVAGMLEHQLRRQAVTELLVAGDVPDADGGILASARQNPCSKPANPRGSEHETLHENRRGRGEKKESLYRAKQGLSSET